MPGRFAFSDLREIFAKANEQKSGDELAGLAAGSETERVAAKRKLAELTLAEIVRQPLIDPSEDDVSRLIFETFNQRSISVYREFDGGRIPRAHSGRFHF